MIRMRKVGGIHFIKAGRLNVSVSISRGAPVPLSAFVFAGLAIGSAIGFVIPV